MSTNMNNMTFSEIISKNNDLNNKIKNENKIFIKILSNITLHQIKPIIEYSLNSNDILCSVEIGEYDNIVKESLEISIEIPIIFWEISNLYDGFAFEIENFQIKKINLLKERIFLELNSLFSNLSTCKSVIFNKFSHLGFSHNLYEKSKFQKFIEDLNYYLINNKPKNFEVIEIDKCISICSIDKSFNFRNFYSNKSLYSPLFFKTYSKFLHPIFRCITGKTKKCIVLDCDNTLWSGIIGEDGAQNVKFHISDTGAGMYFYFISSILKSLHDKGVILCIVSKNNYLDVEEFFSLNINKSILKSENFILKKINWENKDKNLREIANELNIALDSLVFVDDSDFEIDLVRKFIPEISSLQVPKQLFKYPHFAIDYKNLFFSNNQTKEDSKRNKMYLDSVKRNKIKINYNDVNDYIKSLKIKVEIFENETTDIERYSQLTQKTNQFNLSTKRYEITELKNLISLENNHLISLKISDSFGEFGTTGLCILSLKGDFAFVDTFLMSCRVLGRKIEHSFMQELIKFSYRKKRKLKGIIFNYAPTTKNAPIKNFLDQTSEKCEKLENGDIEYFYDKNFKLNNKLHNIIWKKN